LPTSKQRTSEQIYIIGKYTDLRIEWELCHNSS
jgi:hypothetical protein